MIQVIILFNMSNSSFNSINIAWGGLCWAKELLAFFSIFLKFFIYFVYFNLLLGCFSLQIESVLGDRVTWQVFIPESEQVEACRTSVVSFSLSVSLILLLFPSLSLITFFRFSLQLPFHSSFSIKRTTHCVTRPQRSNFCAFFFWLNFVCHLLFLSLVLFCLRFQHFFLSTCYKYKHLFSNLHTQCVFRKLCRIIEEGVQSLSKLRRYDISLWSTLDNFCIHWISEKKSPVCKQEKYFKNSTWQSWLEKY